MIRASKGPAARLTFASLLLLLAPLPSLARSECTDSDGDGYYREGTGCGTAADCNDLDRRVHPGAAEACDGIDNDCDGLLDDASSCRRACGSPFVVGGAEPVGARFVCGQESPDLFWTGSTFGVAWDRSSCARVEFAALDPFGLQLGAETILPRLGDHPQTPSLAWNGSEFAIAWNDLTRDVYVTRLDPFGTIEGDADRITSASLFPSGQNIAWTGTEYGIFWVDNRIERGQIVTGQLAFSRARADGRSIAHPVLASPPNAVMSRPALVWTGSSYALAYQHAPGLFMTTVNPAGHRNRDTLLTASPATADVALAWTGSEIAAVWPDVRDGVPAIYFARFDAFGRKLGPDVRVTKDSPGSFEPSITWTGAEYGVSWTDARDGNPEIYFARLGPSGTKIGTDMRVTFDPAQSGRSVIRWTGDAYGIVFIDTRENPEGNVFFTRVGCR